MLICSYFKVFKKYVLVPYINYKNYNIIITIIVTLQISRFNIFVQNPIKAHIKDEVLQAI